jgi:hypothetical protein
MAKPVPVIPPKTGIFLSADLVRDTLNIFYTICFIAVFKILLFTTIKNPLLIISALTLKKNSSYISSSFFIRNAAFI